MNFSVDSKIKKLIKQASEKAGISYGGEIGLEHPREEGHGDYATNLPMQICRELKVQNSPPKADPPRAEKLKTKIENLKTLNPRELAQLIVNNIEKYDLLEKVEAAGPGFINFWLAKEFLAGEMEKIINDKDNYGLARGNGFLAGKKYMVEFAHPNTHKMFHIGHLRNATTGETLVRILEANGAKIVRANYEGDVGLHIAKCLYSIVTSYGLRVTGLKEIAKTLEKEYKTIKERVEFLGKMYAQGNKAYETEKKAQAEILNINKLIYKIASRSNSTVYQNEAEKAIYELWKVTRQWSLSYFETIYKRLNTHFDRYYFESECFERGKELVLEGLKKGVFEESEGAIVFPGEKFGTHTRVFVTKEGNTTYEGKDMALGELQFKEYSPDLIVHCVGPEQAEYFKVIFEALGQIFPGMKEKEIHVSYGWVKLKQGKMSSREGTVVLGEWLLDEAKERVKKIMEGVKKTQDNNEVELIEKIAISAVKYSFLKVSLSSEIAFDFEESISFEGDSGPYLQYTYARIRSIARKVDNVIARSPAEDGATKQSQNTGIATFHFVRLAMTNLQPEELFLLRWLYRFPEAVCEAGQNYAPNLLCSYLFNLAQKYNLFYNKLPILKAESEELVNFRLMLNEAVGIVLKNGLALLGIEAVEKM